MSLGFQLQRDVRLGNNNGSIIVTDSTMTANTCAHNWTLILL
jgi:hypothetical protein